jgi:hypothetical protein
VLGADIKIENVCETCPLRNILDCETAELISESSGLGFKEGAYVITRYEDKEGQQAEVRITHPAREYKNSLSPPVLYSDSSSDTKAIKETNDKIENCESPEKRGFLRREHCLGGITFRAINKKELEEDEWVRGEFDKGGVGAVVRSGPRTKFRNR